MSLTSGRWNAGANYTVSPAKGLLYERECGSKSDRVFRWKVHAAAGCACEYLDACAALRNGCVRGNPCALGPGGGRTLHSAGARALRALEEELRHSADSGSSIDGRAL